MPIFSLSFTVSKHIQEEWLYNALNEAVKHKVE